jgi:hypothetical protein
MINEDEILFTPNELKIIEDFVIQNPQLRDPFLMNITMYPTDIAKVSPVYGLIFPKGNDHTGFDHIHKRHEQWTNTPKWIETKDEQGNVDVRLQNQSLFRRDSTPFFDYCNIAESIYKKENLNNEKNKRPDKFEMYSGVHIHKDGSNPKYNLLIYKGTKIVHTLYPQSDKNNPERVKGFNYSRGSVSGRWELMNSVLEIKIPYFNHQKIVKYIVIIRRIPQKNIEMGIVQVNDDAGNPWKSIIIGERNIDSKNGIEGLNQVELIQWQYADLRIFEKKILDIEKEEKIK